MCFFFRSLTYRSAHVPKVTWSKCVIVGRIMVEVLVRSMVVAWLEGVSGCKFGAMGDPHSPDEFDSACQCFVDVGMLRNLDVEENEQLDARLGGPIR